MNATGNIIKLHLDFLLKINFYLVLLIPIKVIILSTFD